MPDLEALRAAIDRTDAALADLLARRVRLAQRVALLKHLTRLPPRDPSREDTVRRAYAQRLIAVGWTPDALDCWMDTLIEVSTACQGAVPIAYQGGPGSWSHASLEAEIPYARPLPYASFQSAWRAVCADEAAAAWLPVRNSQLGPFDDVAQILQEGVAWYEVRLAIGHALVGREGLTLDRVRRVIAHPKARAQCAATLARLAPDAEIVEVDDAAAHVASVGLGPEEAALGCPQMANGTWKVIASGVSDTMDNETTFALVVPRGRV